MPLQAGAHLGRYEIRSLLGAGGMGEVYLAHDTSLRRPAAVKLMPAELAQNKDRLQRFEREALAASALNHPNILTIYEVGVEGGKHFIAAEYVEGESLRQHMKRGRAELREALDIALQIASALAAAHQAGIVHRDIKPENVMLRRDGYVKVLDFGLAKLIVESEAARGRGVNTEAPTRALVNTAPGAVMGTPSYMSPEQARGLETDTRSDIWSLGVVLYEMVAGRLPFEGQTPTDVLAMILHREPPSLLLYREGVPVELERIVEKALTKEREERYQTAKDFTIDLKRLKHRLEVDAELERSVTPEEETRREAVRASSGGATRLAGTGATHTAPAARTSGDAAHTTSSAEYIVEGVRRHKLGAALALVALLAAVAGVAYLKLAGGGRGGINSVAVLPFVNAGNDPGTEYLSDGISESLINKLSQLPQLKVIARSSAFRYKGKEIDPQEVAKALGVQALVTGRVTQRGDGLQISVELVNASDKTQMWGEQYTRRAADLQAVQAEIAHTVSEKLRLRLTGAQEQQLSKRLTDNPQAYDLYLNGMASRTRAGGLNAGRQALSYFNQAVALDPNFAAAHARVADAYYFLLLNGAVDPKEAVEKARAATERALALDDTLAEAHVALALIKVQDWDWAGADAGFKRAIALNPNLADAHFRYSQYLPVVERFDEALAEIRRVQELDPLRLNARGQEGVILFFARRYDEAIRRIQSVLEVEPNSLIGLSYLGHSYSALGRYEEAIATYRKVVSVVGEDDTGIQRFLGHALAKSGRRGEALAILDKLKATKEHVSQSDLAGLYVALGDREAALQSLERAYAARDIQLQYLKVDPFFDELRPDPRFQSLVRRVGLTP